MPKLRISSRAASADLMREISEAEGDDMVLPSERKSAGKVYKSRISHLLESPSECFDLMLDIYFPRESAGIPAETYRSGMRGARYFSPSLN